MAARTSKSRSPLRPCAIKSCDAAPRRRKYCPGHSKSAPMRTLAREGAWSTLTPAKPVVAKKAAPAKARTRTAPKARRTSSTQVAGSKYLAQAAAQVKAGNLSVEGYAALASVLAA